MARERSSGRLVKFWWAAAFTAGVAAGAVCFGLLGAQRTAWIVGFLGAVAGAVATYEQFTEPGMRAPGPARTGWARRGWPQPAASRKSVKTKPTSRRGQLRAIEGRKPAAPADPPESPPPSSDAPPTSGAS